MRNALMINTLMALTFHLYLTSSLNLNLDELTKIGKFVNFSRHVLRGKKARDSIGDNCERYFFN